MVLAQRLGGQANPCACVLLPSGALLWGALWMGRWRLLALWHSTNKQGRIFELSLVAGALAPLCRQPMSVPGSLRSCLPLG